MKLSACTDVGRVRSDNQDSYLAQVLDEAAGHVLLAVADGMGGYAGGQVASRLAIETMAAALQAGAPEWSGPGARSEGLLTAVRAAHAAIRQAQGERPDHADMGTTMTVALVWGEVVHVAHSGDSRAYLVSGGRIRQLTDDHSVAGELVRSGNITAEEAQVHPQRHILTNVLGMHGPVRVDAAEVSWQPGDVLLLCSDGLTNEVSDAELARHAADTAAFTDLAPRLVELANQRGGHDNITVLAAWWER